MLPLSTAFAVKGGALRADYPARWLDIRDQVRAQETRCALCGDRGALHIAHLDSQPDRLDRANLAALCRACHAAWDEPHVMAASALTNWVRWGNDLRDAAEDAIEHVRRYGPARLTPAMVDVVTADILLERPRPAWVLANILQDEFRLEDHDAARRVMGASLHRLRMRGLHIPRQGWISLR
ncbi:HNH endonuclease [Deinococcus aquaticus]